MRELIDKQEILDFPREEYSGFFNFACDLIEKNNLGMQEEDAYQLCEDILDGIMNVIESAEVIEAKEIICAKNISKEGFLCSACSFGDFGGFHGYEPKYCPNCGAKIERIENNETD